MSTIANAIGALKTSSAPAPTTPMLRAIPDAENFGARTAYKGKGIVEATFALRRGEGQPRYEKDCVFDFSKVSEEQLHLLAMYGAKVKVPAVKSMTKALGITEEKARAMLATASADADKADKKVAKK
jgi:hypothetical protein